jgi:hypothetical protein
MAKTIRCPSYCNEGDVDNSDRFEVRGRVGNTPVVKYLIRGAGLAPQLFGNGRPIPPNPSIWAADFGPDEQQSA